jgi:hypothetical protein
MWLWVVAWIESHTVLLRHRKLIELAKDLRLKPVYALGHLHALWHAALEQQEDGDLSSWSDELIAEMSGFDGGAPQYVSLLRLHGWLNDKILHDWLDYAGKYLTAKYRTANPKKLRQILLKHKSVNDRTKNRSKSGRDAIGLSHHKVLNSSSSEEGLGETKEFPEWLDPEVWDAFRKHRAAMPKKYHLTANAEKLAFAQLGKWAAMGHDPNEIVRTSIMNGWAGIFKPKTSGEKNKVEMAADVTARILKQGIR